MSELSISVLPPVSFQFRPAVGAITGGTPVSGPPQRGNLAAGFHWVCAYDTRVLHSRETFAAWQGSLARMMVVNPCLDVRWLSDLVAPWPAGQSESAPPVPHSDGSFLSDGSGYLTASINFELVEDVAMNATAATIRLISGSGPIGGEPFTLIGESGLARLHVIAGVEDNDDGTYDIRFAPDAREDYTAGTFVDFERARCAMTFDLTSLDGAWAPISLGYLSQPKIQFVEYFPDV